MVAGICRRLNVILSRGNTCLDVSLKPSLAIWPSLAAGRFVATISRDLNGGRSLNAKRSLIGGALFASFFVSESLSSFLAVVLGAVSWAFFVEAFWPDVAELEVPPPGTGALPPPLPDAWEPWPVELPSTMVAAMEDHAGRACVAVSVL